MGGDLLCDGNDLIPLRSSSPPDILDSSFDTRHDHPPRRRSEMTSPQLFFRVTLTLALVSSALLSIEAGTGHPDWRIGGHGLVKKEGNPLGPGGKWRDAYEWAAIGGVAALLSVYFLLLIIIPPSLVLIMLLDQEKGQFEEGTAAEAERFLRRSVETMDRRRRREVEEVTSTTVNVSASPRVWWARFGAVVFIIGIPVTFFASAVLMLGLVLVPYEDEEKETGQHEPGDLSPMESPQAHRPHGPNEPHGQERRASPTRNLRIQTYNNPKVGSSFMKTLSNSVLFSKQLAQHKQTRRE